MVNSKNKDQSWSEIFKSMENKIEYQFLKFFLALGFWIALSIYFK
jgi:membrane protein required for beta-lactamase induction